MSERVQRGEVTELLASWQRGDPRAEERLLGRIYHELQRIAGVYLRRERNGHTLEPAALVHEAYLRLLKQRAISFSSREQFFALAARMMQRVLIDHERRRKSAKREGGVYALPLVEDSHLPARRESGREDLERALGQLAEVDERKAAIIELRFFDGLTVQETAAALDCSPRTVHYEWQVAKAWLFRELAGHDTNC